MTDVPNCRRLPGSGEEMQQAAAETMPTAPEHEALRLAMAALESCTPGDTSSGHVIYPSFDPDAVSAAIEAVEAALTQTGGWQPIERVQPVSDKRMLLVVDCGPGTDAWVRTGYSYPGDKDWFSDELRGQSLASYGYRVTHACEMPLPPSPAAEREVGA